MVSGLLGIGGGILIVPFLYFLMSGAEWSGMNVLPQHEAALAHATSLALILPTAVSGLVSYDRKGIVAWSSVLSLGLAAAVAAFLGARVAVLMPAPLLKASFGSFLLLMSWRLATGRDRSAHGSAPAGGSGRIRWPAALVGGGLVGFLSALLGVGGGVVAIPVLIHWARLELHRVAAASLGVITFAALSGTLGYALGGMAIEELPPGSIGFVHLPVLAAMLPGAILCAPLGARLNQMLPTRRLEQLFALLLLVVGAQLLWSNAARLLGEGG